MNLLEKLYEVATYPVSDNMAFMILTPMLVIIAVGMFYRMVRIVKGK